MSSSPQPQHPHHVLWAIPGVARIPVAPTAGRHQSEPVVWGATAEARDRVVGALLAGDDPVSAPQGPWAAVVVRPDGQVVATASTALPGGLVRTVDTNTDGQRELIIGPDLGAVVRARTAGTTLSGEWIRAELSDFLPSAATTPYTSVHHLRFGITAKWRPGEEQPSYTEWFGPDTLPQPAISGPESIAAYVAEFDATIDELVTPGAPICATLSGGLDSSFVVASLARHATPDNPVHCYSHSPHPDAGLQSVGNWDPDDFQYALAMQRAYPGRVVVHRVINDQLRDPLDFLIDASMRSWLPSFNVNGVWFEQMSDHAADREAAVLFEGTNGNASFSYDHPYAGGYYLRRGDVRSAIRLLDAEHRQGSSVMGTAKRLLSPLAVSYRRRKGEGPMAAYLASVGLGWMSDGAPATFSSIPGADRDGYLSWLTRTGGSALSGSPLAWSATPVDPFVTRRMCEMAARIEPEQWRRGSLARGFARAAGVGRVPDEIRLRTRRGSQSADFWFVARRYRQRYLDELDMLAATPHLEGWVDHREVQRMVNRWAWDSPRGPSFLELAGLLKVLTMAEFIRRTNRRLQGATMSL